MDYLGLFCLGAFVGTIATFGMNKVASLKDWQTVLSLTLPAVLSGAAMVFIDRFKYSPAFGCYPLGLAVALMWAYTQKSVDNLKAGPTSVRVLALLHLFGAAVVTISGAVVATVPALCSRAAERQVSDRRASRRCGCHAPRPRGNDERRCRRARGCGARVSPVVNRLSGLLRSARRE
jgi:hypothetical protein